METATVTLRYLFYNMGGDCGSRSHQPHIGQAPNFSSTGTWVQPYSGLQKHSSNYMVPWHETIASNRSLSVSVLAEPRQPQVGHSEPHSLFYCLPTVRQAMFPPSNSVIKEQFLVEPDANSKKVENCITGSQLPQKQFLVFDQTGGQTTMIFSSGVGAPPLHCLSHWRKKLVEASIFHPEKQSRKEPMLGNSGTILLDNFVDMNRLDEDHESDVQSEMHEDTEELNALMYFDDDTDSDDDEDEVTSTAHTRSTLTGNDKQYGFVEIIEEVASSDEEPTKRQKISPGENGVAQTEGGIKLNHGTFRFDDDTEFCFGSGKVSDSGNTISLSGNKRARNHLVRETVRNLQGMIPGGKGATPAEVIDEAIHFLISLKLKLSM